MTPVLECNGLTKAFGRKKALSDVSLKIDHGQIVGLLGPNGSGKTTLIKLANALLTPSAGEIRIAGMTPGLSTKKIISYLPERNYLNDWMRVQDIIACSVTSMKISSPRRPTICLRLNIRQTTGSRPCQKAIKKVQLVLVMSREAELYLLMNQLRRGSAARDYTGNHHQQL